MKCEPITTGRIRGQINQIAEDKKNDSGRQKAEVRIEFEGVKQHIGGVHATIRKAPWAKFTVRMTPKIRRQAQADQA